MFTGLTLGCIGDNLRRAPTRVSGSQENLSVAVSGAGESRAPLVLRVGEHRVICPAVRPLTCAANVGSQFCAANVVWWIRGSMTFCLVSAVVASQLDSVNGGSCTFGTVSRAGVPAILPGITHQLAPLITATVLHPRGSSQAVRRQFTSFTVQAYENYVWCCVFATSDYGTTSVQDTFELGWRDPKALTVQSGYQVLTYCAPEGIGRDREYRPACGATRHSRQRLRAPHPLRCSLLLAADIIIRWWNGWQPVTFVDAVCEDPPQPPPPPVAPPPPTGP
ncbi:hypothetical protein FQR65_LT20223 [Abscondita terminalis]|nr:hypothetical protein FQR65_LT20223 [Abscondita terminalis]